MSEITEKFEIKEIKFTVTICGDSTLNEKTLYKLISLKPWLLEVVTEYRVLSGFRKDSPEKLLHAIKAIIINALSRRKNITIFGCDDCANVVLEQDRFICHRIGGPGDVTKYYEAGNWFHPGCPIPDVDGTI